MKKFDFFFELAVALFAILFFAALFLELRYKRAGMQGTQAPIKTTVVATITVPPAPVPPEE